MCIYRERERERGRELLLGTAVAPHTIVNMQGLSAVMSNLNATCMTQYGSLIVSQGGSKFSISLFA